MHSHRNGATRDQSTSAVFTGGSVVRGWKGDGGREGRGERGAGERRGGVSGDKEEVRMFPFRSFDPDMKDVSTRTKYSDPDHVLTRGNLPTHLTDVSIPRTRPRHRTCKVGCMKAECSCERPTEPVLSRERKEVWMRQNFGVSTTAGNVGFSYVKKSSCHTLPDSQS